MKMNPGLNTKTNAKHHPSAQGFSLIELLVVVAVILIIAAIAIPNFIQSKERANESAAVQNLRTITTANVIYSTTYADGYSPNLSDLGGNAATITATSAELIDTILATGQKSGYSFQYAVTTTDAFGNPTGYTANADPITQNITGMRHFYTDQTMVIRENNTVPASATDNPIQ
jgi:type IV pilus assembly protein PilA